ncbi:MAG: hypothetical protein GXO22_03005 [Aquificae bacterium]|nr:hypothetical protein [Aquificota bacterium]
MKYLKHVLLGDGLDKEIQKTFISILGEDLEKDFLDFYDFYKIRGVLEGDILKISMYFESEDSWYDIAKVNLLDKKIISQIDKNLLRNLLLKENRFLIENYDKELQRSSNIILSIIAFITGVAVSILLIKIFS